VLTLKYPMTAITIPHR